MIGLLVENSQYAAYRKQVNQRVKKKDCAIACDHQSDSGRVFAGSHVQVCKAQHRDGHYEYTCYNKREKLQDAADHE